MADNKYLLLRENCWHIDLILPAKFGGKRIRHSLHTSDVKRARYIRDTVIIPLVHKLTALELLEAIAAEVETLDKQIKDDVKRLKNDILNHGNEYRISNALELYYLHLEKMFDRTSTIKSYKSALNVSFSLLEDINLNDLDREKAIFIRDKLLKNKMSTARLSFNIQRITNFLDWCLENNMCKKTIADSFKIDLPTVHKKRTSIIPETCADQAMNMLSNWIAPVIARYTGMRLMEIINLKFSDIREEGGVLCILLDDSTKTREPRIIPVAEKLLPYMTKRNINSLKKLGHKNDTYNKLIKTIKGCEDCSFHSWRVYANSQMHKNSIDPYVCKMILGHKSGKDVHAVYTYVYLEQMKRAVDTIL